MNSGITYYISVSGWSIPPPLGGPATSTARIGFARFLLPVWQAAIFAALRPDYYKQRCNRGLSDSFLPRLLARHLFHEHRHEWGFGRNMRFGHVNSREGKNRTVGCL